VVIEGLNDILGPLNDYEEIIKNDFVDTRIMGTISNCRNITIRACAYVECSSIKEHFCLVRVKD